jgi:FtsP/CotA-like multicopper oxidase with cupredoxin domain
MLNGKNRKVDLSAGAHALWQVTSGKKYLFRLINSAAQNVWWMHFDNHNMTVIAMDNVPIVPYTTDWLAIGTGQRYDVVITANQAVGNYFFRAVSQSSCADIPLCSNTGLGSANGILQYSGAPTTLPTTSPGTSRTNFATCQDEPLASLVPYVPKSAGSASAFKAGVSTLPVSPVTLVQTSDDGAVFKWFLNGNAISVNWTQPTIQSLAQGNNTAISNALILPNGNTWVYFVIQNQFPAGHPMHLHGHDFALLGQGTGSFSSSQVSSLNFANPTRRDTAMLLGNGYTIIGFITDNPGAWLMHCHIAWHVDGGLALQFIEVPSQIPAPNWVASNGFQDQCSKYAAYEAAGGAKKTNGESGLKIRREYDKLDSAMVRRSGHKRKFLDAYKARRGAHF